MANRVADARHLRLCRKYWRKLRKPLTEIAARHGYALAVHGSLTYDFDLVAIPWVEAAAPAPVVVEAIRQEAERLIGYAFPLAEETGDYFENGCPGNKAHGRLVWSFHLGGGPYIDLSVLPLRGEVAKAPGDGWYISANGEWCLFPTLDKQD